MIGIIVLDDIGAISSPAAMSVDSSGATAHNVSDNQKGVSFQNTGSGIAWYGGSNVDPATKRGNQLFPNQTLVYKNVKKSFSVYFKCAAGISTTISVVESA